MTFHRWFKFNVVGIAGAGVQLGVLSVLNHISPAHYLLNAAIALEVTLLHNFVWHVRYTWRDRPESASTTTRLLRFHLSNGGVSLVGNLGLMQLLISHGRIPVLAANAMAIITCSAINYILSDRWSFALSAKEIDSITAS